MNTTTFESHIETLRNAIQNNNLAIFIGSGISRCTNPEIYPSWGEICDELKNELDPNLKENDYLKIAQLYQLEFGELKMKERVKSFFPEQDIPGDIQSKILDINPHYIITTNWDNLFDNEINNNGRIYDIIAKDKELVESNKTCKYIKMHGDFLHDNYVFTEDDYLNYSNNFPLIENYLKSILSTHVVLFMGYSFSDIDLKQIETWIQNKTDVTISIFLIKFKNEISDVEIKYLKKFNITVLELKLENKSDEEKKTAIINFLDRLNNKKNNEIITEPEQYVYNLLKPLENYPVILRQQIENHLTNCGFIYDDNLRAILVFYKAENDIITTDYDYEKRILFSKFVELLPESILNENDYSDKLKRIIIILKKADINGIVTKDTIKQIKYFNFDKIDNLYNNHNYKRDSSILDFDYDIKPEENYTPQELLINVKNLVAIGSYKDAFFKIMQCIKFCRKQRDYINLFICFFNFNYLLINLKSNIFSNTTSKQKYEKYSSYNLEDEYQKLPKKIQLQVRDIVKLVTLDSLYKEIFFIDKNYEKVENSVKIIKDGGFSFSDDSERYPTDHKNLIDFVLGNHILLENYSEYKYICQKYFIICLNRQYFNDKLLLNKYEIYTAIKYFSNKELQSLFEEKLGNKDWHGIEIDDSLVDWLVNKVLENCIKYFKKLENMQRFSFGGYIENIFYILSMQKINHPRIDLILKKIRDLVDEALNTSGIFSAINLFFNYQYHFNEENKFPEKAITDIIDTLLDKFISQRCNGYEDDVISNNKIYNIFGYYEEQEYKYKDSKRINRLLSLINEEKPEKQANICTNLLFQLFQISDEKCKKIIKDYINNKDFIELKKDEDLALKYYIYNLSLQLYEIKMLSEDFISELELFIKENADSVALYGQISKLLKKDPRFEESNKLVQNLKKEKDKCTKDFFSSMNRL